VREQKFAEDEAQALKRRVIERIGAWNTADAIRSEKLFRHVKEY
jgi:hypothetical protein